MTSVFGDVSRGAGGAQKHCQERDNLHLLSPWGKNAKVILGCLWMSLSPPNAEGSHFPDASGKPCPGIGGKRSPFQMPACSPGDLGSCTLVQLLGLAGAQD